MDARYAQQRADLRLATLHARPRQRCGPHSRRTGQHLCRKSLDRLQGFCNKVVVDAFDPGILLSTWATHTIDFSTVQEEELQDIAIPLAFVCKGPAALHGVACWFDVLFPGSSQQVRPER
jgi:hypothetical protein